MASVDKPGSWDEKEYLSLSTNHLVEFTEGFIEVLAMPTPAHQRIVLYLLDEVHSFARPKKLGEVLTAPMPVRLQSQKYREPDLMFMLTEHAFRKKEDYWEGADLVMEVVSNDAESRERDYAKKRDAYAEAGFPEYWIVDPQEKRIVVLTLHRGQYVVHGDFVAGQRATSVVLPGFSVDVNTVFVPAKGS